jgi:hypothetical protein
MDNAKAKILHELLCAIVETVKEAGDMGAPSGVMYAALMYTGMTLEAYQQTMNCLVLFGNLRHSGHVYYWLKDVPAWKAA